MGVSELQLAPGALLPPPPHAESRVLIFRLAGQAYGLPLAAIREIVPMPLLSRPPGIPAVLAGFLDLEGMATPVVSLARLFGLTEQPPGLYTPLLLVRCGGLPLALLVDAVEGIAPIEESVRTPLGENCSFNDCAVGLARVGDRNVILLSAERLLREQEQRRFADLAAAEQTRMAGLEEAMS